MYMEELKKKLCKELEKIAERGEITSSSLDTIHKMTDTIKNIYKIEMLKGEDEESEYSGRRSYGGSYRSYRDSYDDGSSYRRRRDSMGRFTEGYDSRRGSYSRDEARNEIKMHLEDLMHIASNDKEREALQEALEAIRNA